MPLKTKYLVKCRCGEFVPLMQKDKAHRSNDPGRFYLAHKQPQGCGQYDNFPPDIGNVQDLDDMTDVVLKEQPQRGKSQKESVSKPPKTTPPTKPVKSVNVPDGYGDGDEPEEIADDRRVDDVEPEDKKDEENEFALNRWHSKS